MREQVLFTLFFFLAAFSNGFTIEVKLKNPSDIPLSCTISLVRSYTDCPLREFDPPEYREKQFSFLKSLGINGLQYFEYSLIPEVLRHGFLYIRHGGAIIFQDDYYKKKEEIEEKMKSSALGSSGAIERYDAIKNVRNLKLGDEISSGLLQDYLAGGEKIRIEVIEYLKNYKVPFEDILVSKYQDIEQKPAPLLKIENPGLFYWINRIRMERINKSQRTQIKSISLLPGEVQTGL